ncbi:hypothetical protein GCT19_04145 [Paraburkholderia sp. CNPSo 3155]|uniref:hypothetical protein n=1 Tax=Paraburkholderia atlantica TaxID=2654982 RepID=UPI00128C22EF|nr:hypothetical protein [Paraburkholderia atlantica]MPW04847.1 hypothetical protein [Paraburkholderia atlantica]
MSIDIREVLEQSRADRVAAALPPGKRWLVVQAAFKRFRDAMEGISEVASVNADNLADLGGDELTYPFRLSEYLEPDPECGAWCVPLSSLLKEARVMAQIVNDWTERVLSAAKSLELRGGQAYDAEDMAIRDILAGLGYEVREDLSMVNTAYEQRLAELGEQVERRSRSRKADEARAGFRLVPKTEADKQSQKPKQKR